MTTNESPPEDLPKRVRSEASQIQAVINADKGRTIAEQVRTHVNADALPGRAT